MPKEYKAVHISCVKLVQQVEEFVVGDDYRFLQITKYNLSEEDKKYFDECVDVWDFLQKYKKEQFYSLLNKTIIMGLLKDFCYFIHESLDCSNKMRLVVSCSLLRRPIVDNLKILLRIIGDNSFFDNFIEGDDYDPTKMEDEELKRLLDITDELRFANPITGAFIYKLVFDKSNPGSVINLSNKAIHPVTTRPWNKTGAMNCNFMFMTRADIEMMWGHYYSTLPVILIFYSELFNAVIFNLFKDEVDRNILCKRLKRMEDILKPMCLRQFE